MHLDGTLETVQAVEQLILDTNNFILLANNADKSRSFTRKYLVYYTKGDAKRATKKGSALLWILPHGTINISYDKREKANHPAGIFINALDFSGMTGNIKGLKDALWAVKISLRKVRHGEIKEFSPAKVRSGDH